MSHEVPEVVGAEEIRQRLSALLDELRADPDRVVVVGRHRRPEAVIVSWSAWQDIEEAAKPETDRAPSVGDDLGRWTQAEAISYEVACETFNALIAWCTAKMWEERDGAADPRVIEQWRQRRVAYIAKQKNLDAADPGAVAQVIREYGPQVKALYAEEK